MPDWVVGVDEVGYGAFAGPVVISAYALPPEVEISDNVKDSKKFYSEAKRKKATKLLNKNHRHFFNFWILPEDVKGVCNVEGGYRYQNWSDAMHYGTDQALSQLCCILNKKYNDPKIRMVMDGNNDHGIPGLVAIPKADATVAAVAAASMQAKVSRDSYMIMLHDIMIGYGIDYSWDKNKGYGTQEHVEAMQKYGISRIHRLNIAAVKKIEEEKGYWWTH